MNSTEDLSRWEANADSDFIGVSPYDGVTLIKDPKSVPEEGRLDWNEVFEGGQ